MKMEQVSEHCFAVLNEKNLVCDANSGFINLGGGVVVGGVAPSSGSPGCVVDPVSPRNTARSAPSTVGFSRAGCCWKDWKFWKTDACSLSISP